MKKALISIVIIVLLLSCVFLAIERNYTEQPAAIEEIPDTHVQSAVNNTDYRYFVISDPPEDLYELKILVEDYTEKYIDDNCINVSEEETLFYDWRFFRETEEINTEWKQSDGYFTVDRIEDHFNDVIAAVSWYSQDEEKRYIIRRISQNSDEDRIIETKEFLGQRLIE